MDKIEFKNNAEPAINDANLNLLQDNIEKAISGTEIPVAAGMDYFGTVAPDNYMFADGSAISRSEFSELFSKIGTTYGSGDGSTTFNLPDKREAVTIMKGNTYSTVGSTTGSNTKTITKDNLPATTIRVKYQKFPITGNSDDVGSYNKNSRAITFNTGDTTSTSQMQTENLGSGTAFNVMQKSLICNYIIRVK